MLVCATFYLHVDRGSWIYMGYFYCEEMSHGLADPQIIDSILACSVIPLVLRNVLKIWIHSRVF
jgi:hypothetical protein